MKQLARYKVNFDSPAILWSAAMMGVSIFAQAMYFLVFSNIREAETGTLVVFLILPMALEAAWILLLKSKLNAAGIYGIVGSLACILLTVQLFCAAGTLQIVLGTVAYLLGIALLLMITGGFFPYKYFGMALFALIGFVRFFCFDMSRYIQPRDWFGFVLELASLSMIVSLMLFFGGISGRRNDA